MPGAMSNRPRTDSASDAVSGPDLSNCSTPQPCTPGTLQNMLNWPQTPTTPGTDETDLMTNHLPRSNSSSSNDVQHLCDYSSDNETDSLQNTPRTPENDTPDLLGFGIMTIQYPHSNSSSSNSPISNPQSNCGYFSGNETDDQNTPLVFRQSGINHTVSSESSQNEAGVQDCIRQLISSGTKSDWEEIRDKLHRYASETDRHSTLEVVCQVLKETNREKELYNTSLLGKEQETALCVAIIKENLAAAKVLIKYGGSELILHEYTKEYAGLTALHIAVLKEDVPILKYMLSSMDQASIHKSMKLAGKGKFFRERLPLCWFPLTLAACSGNTDIFDLLLEHGADPLQQDEETGNTFCHYLARVARHYPDKACEMLKHILTWQKKTQQNDKRILLRPMNKNQHTPLTYAASLGSIKFAEAILEIDGLYTFKQWQLGSDQSKMYEVSEIDPRVRRDQRMTTVLETYSVNRKQDILKLGGLPAVYQMTKHKWNTYKWWFFSWCVYHMFVMIFFTTCTQYREVISNTTNISISNLLDIPNKPIVGLEVFVFCAAVLYVVCEMLDLITCFQGDCSFKRLSKHWVIQMDFFQIVLLVFSVSVIVLPFLRFISSPWQDLVYAMAAISGWSFLLFFTRASKNIGIFTAMMQRMITRELFYFAVVFGIILAGFGTATYCMLEGDKSHEQVSDLYRTFYSLFRVLVGLEELEIADEARIPWVMRIIFLLFVLMSNILLLNLLIAAMNNTYDELEDLKELVWLQMRTRAVLMIERRLPFAFMKPKNRLEPVKEGNENNWYLQSQEEIKGDISEEE